MPLSLWNPFKFMVDELAFHSSFQLQLFVYQSAFFQLEVEEFFQGIGALAVLTVGRVVFSTVGDDPLQVSDEDLLGHIIPVLQPFSHGFQILRGKHNILI